MKRSFFVLALLVLMLNACTSSDEETCYDSQNEALVAYDCAFKSNFNLMVSSRSSVSEADGEASDSLLSLLGRELCYNLETPTNVLLSEFGLTDQVLMDAYREYEDNFCDATTFDEYKCFTALVLYDAYKASKPQINSRSDAMDLAGCIVLGAGFKQLADMGTVQIAKFAAKKLAGRLVPYVGWGWAVASAANCIAKL